MAHENYTHPRASRCGQRHGTAFDYASAFSDLAANAHLHVIDKQCRASGFAEFFKVRWNGEAANLLHCALATKFPAPWVRSNGSATSTEGSNRNSSGSGAPSGMYCHSMRPALLSGRPATYCSASAMSAHSNTITTPP